MCFACSIGKCGSAICMRGIRLRSNSGLIRGIITAVYSRSNDYFVLHFFFNLDIYILNSVIACFVRVMKSISTHKGVGVGLEQEIE